MTDNPFDHLSPVWTHLTNEVIDRGEGAYVYTASGRRLLDLTCGIAVTNTGHCHPKVVKAIQEQAARLIHAQINIYYTSRPCAWSRRCGAWFRPLWTPSSSATSGAEAGRSLGQAGPPRHRSAGSDRLPGQLPWTDGRHHVADHLQDGLPPQVPAAHAGRDRGALPEPYRHGWDPETASRWCLNELRHMLHTHADPSETAALLVRAGAGRGGVPGAAALFPAGPAPDRRRAWPAADPGRGAVRLWAYRQVLCPGAFWGGARRPGHGQGAGLRPTDQRHRRPAGADGPLAARHTRPAPTAATAVACAAASGHGPGPAGGRAWWTTPPARATRLMAGLRALQKKHPVIGEVRGLGLMVGVEFTTKSGEPDPGHRQGRPGALPGQRPDPAHLRPLRQRHSLDPTPHHHCRADRHGAVHL